MNYRYYSRRTRFFRLFFYFRRTPCKYFYYDDDNNYVNVYIVAAIVAYLEVRDRQAIAPGRHVLDLVKGR